MESRVGTNKIMMNIALITIDSLRYDTTQVADTPYIRKVFRDFNLPHWVPVGANATYTLPAHICLFQEGRLPSTNDPAIQGVYNRNAELMFRVQLNWERDKPALYPTPSAPNLVKGFTKLGYRTMGIGGVHWFDSRYPTSNFWKKSFFEEFYWDEGFGEEHENALESQTNLIEKKLTPSFWRAQQPLFFFLNISSCHYPFRNNERSVAGQAQALEYVDSQLERVFDLLPKPCHVVLMADHGECIGESGLFGHGFYHPKVMEIPMAAFIIPS